MGVFYFKNEKRLYFDLTKSSMQNVVAKLSSSIIISHMTDTLFDQTNLFKTDKFKLSFYDDKGKKLYGNFNEKVDLSKKFIQHEDHFILVDDSALGHLGVYYIVLEENLFAKKIEKLKRNIWLIFTGFYALIAAGGFYLARLFLKPIEQERERMNNFIKDTTHELNTPISAILMSTQAEILSQKQLERIRFSAQRISEMYKDLTYVFLEEKNLLKETKLYSIKALIEEQLEYFEPLYMKKKIELTTSMDESVFVMNKDEFVRIFNNLLSNAIKYNRVNGKIQILLNKGILCIKDKGIGMNPTSLQDIFKRYHRANKEQGGFGIGLNIVSEICKKYDIKIRVTSEINKGTTFILTFPSSH